MPEGSFPHQISGLRGSGFTWTFPLHPWTHIHQCAELSLLRHPIVQTSSTRFRNFNRIPITYAFRPRLRGRLTLSGLAFLRKPWAYGEQVSHLFYRYSCRHRLFRYVHNASRHCFNRLRNAPLPSLRIPSFGTNLKPRVFSAPNHLTSELLRFL